jgi:uncharacterized protein involved in exopolysaccharide biosynthesis
MVRETAPEPASEEEFTLEQLKELVGMFLRAPRRHPHIATLTLFATLLLGLGIAIFAPRWYECDVRILAQRNLVLPALGNPNRAVPREADSPTKNAADTILQRDNMVALIKQLDLVDRWQSTRQPTQRLKDKILSPLAGTRSDDDRLLDMVGLLEKQLAVGSDDASITISVEWPNRDLAYEIVSFLQKNFLEARYDSNVNVISEAIRILEERAKPESAEVDAALADLTRIEAQRRQVLQGSTRVGDRAPAAVGGAARRRTGAPGAVPPASPASPSDDTASDSASQLEEVRRRIRLIKDDRERQLLQAQNQLADERATLGPMHPTVLALNEKIAQLSQTPPELQTLTARERQLIGDLARSSETVAASSPPAADAAPLPAPVAAPGSSPVAEAQLRDDPEVTLALSRLQAVSAKYNEMLSRIEAANIELEVTRAAFKYQYTVVRPAELPRKPSRPNVPLVLLLAVVGAALLAMLVPGGLDLIRGRFVEEWQLERKLGLPLLGELNPPR